MAHQFRTEQERKVTISRNEQEHILKIDPSFQAIKEAVYFDNYDLPCPIRVTVTKKDNSQAVLVLRQNRHGNVRKEVQIFRALKEYGLPVPEVLSGPFKMENGEHAATYSLLPGENLQKLGMKSGKDLELAKKLLIEAVLKLIDATEYIKNHEISKYLPYITLISELEKVNTKDNPWFKEEFYRSAVTKLEPILKNMGAPLVLSNGDYQPGNFLAENGIITGYLDFESPSFQDPMMGFVKYPIYDMLPLARTDIVQIFLNKKGYSERDFNYRLALGCLKTLNQEIPVSGGDEEMEKYRTRTIHLLKQSIKE